MRHFLSAATCLFALGCSQGLTPTQGIPEGPAMAARDTALLRPAPNAQGRLISTDLGTDVAIRGDAMFVLAKTRTPGGIGELVFSRDGAFHLEERPGAVAGTGTYELVNRSGLFVMAYQSVTDPATRPFGTVPEESVNDLNARMAGPGSGQVRPTAIVLDLVANPDAANNIEFDEQGMLRFKGEAPRDAANNPMNVHLTLAVFSFAQYLKPLGADAYAYQSIAGRVFLGTAGNSQGGREVGSANVIEDRTLERR